MDNWEMSKRKSESRDYFNHENHLEHWVEPEPKQAVKECCTPLMVTDESLKQCMSQLLTSIQKGLDPATRSESTVKCFNTFVQDLPTGKDVGQYLALDLGGTNFRVLLVKLNKAHFDMESKIYVIPDNIMVGSGEQLFDHIASCLASFSKEHHITGKLLPLGFTFSFPLEQRGLTKGVLQKWTKGFNCSGVVGEDVVLLLKKSLDKQNINIDVVAVLNDTTGTLMSCAWKAPNCRLGVILGTGTNACYVEKVENVIGFKSDPEKPYVLINTEWGAFGQKGELDFLRTSFDREVDANSPNPGNQIHEKLISGMYLGELARLIIVKLTRENHLFDGVASEKLLEPKSFLTKHISDIESDRAGSYAHCREVFNNLNMPHITDQECADIRFICECISKRAAFLASAGIATIVNKMGVADLTVGVDGSLYRFHPKFHKLMTDKIKDLVDPSINRVKLMLSEDGSGRGAALIAAAAAASRNSPNASKRSTPFR